MSKQLTILFAPLDAFGHVMPCIGFAEILRDRGHSIVFAVDKSWKGIIAKYGFKEELYTDSLHEENGKPSQVWTNLIESVGKDKTLRLSPLEQIDAFGMKAMSAMIVQASESVTVMSDIVARVKPDIIIVDSLVCLPTLINCGIPWVSLVSVNPLMYIDDLRTPPSTSGLPEDSGVIKGLKYRSSMLYSYGLFWISYTIQMKFKYRLPFLPYGRFITHSPYLNLYAFPEEIDYTDMRPMPAKWHRIDAFIRTDNGNFELPAKLKYKSGKLIYFSLGSIGSSDLSLMIRLVEMLSKSPHRFIVSKGPMHDKYELPDNMWGEEIVPQMKILPLVDLVITHGGNNTITETLFFGKPMIVMPLFLDQPDNAQRIHEKGFGIRLQPYTCTDEELHCSIEKLLNDTRLMVRLNQISQRMKRSNTLSVAAEYVENLAN